MYKIPNGNLKPKHADKKAHNRYKLRMIRNAQSILNKISICHIYTPCGDNQSECDLVFQGTDPVKPTSSLNQAFNSIRTNWEAIIGVLCRDQSGQNYVRYSIFQVQRECVAADINQLLFNACKQIYSNAIKMHRICPFWIAMPKKFNTEESDITKQKEILLKTLSYFKVISSVPSEFEYNVNKAPPSRESDQYWFNIDLRMDEVDIDIPAIYEDQPDADFQYSR